MPHTIAASVAQSRKADLAPGQTLSVRLSGPVYSEHSRTGDPVEATVTYPLCKSGENISCPKDELVLAPGTKVQANHPLRPEGRRTNTHAPAWCSTSPTSFTPTARARLSMLVSSTLTTLARTRPQQRNPRHRPASRIHQGFCRPRSSRHVQFPSRDTPSRESRRSTAWSNSPRDPLPSRNRPANSDRATVHV